MKTSPNKRGAGKGGFAVCGVLAALGPPCLTASFGDDHVCVNSS
jgi:hypothetical protein